MSEATSPEAKRTRVAENDDAKNEVVVSEKKQEQPPSWLTSNENSATVPSWQSTQSAPAWNSTATTTSGKEIPSWLSSGSSSFDKPSSSTSSSVPSWLSAGANQTSSVFGSAAASSSSFGALSSSASVFGAKKEDAEENEDSEGSGGEESGGENDAAAAAFGHGADKEDEQAAPPASVETGEENESVLLQLRVKLYRLAKSQDSNATAAAAWSDVGSGPLRLNTPNNDGEEKKLMPRLIMRRQGVWTLLLNAPITADFVYQAVGDKMIRISCESFTGEETSSTPMQTFLIKCSRQDDRDELLRKIQSVMPPTEKGDTTKPKTGLVEANNNTDETKE